MAEAMYWKAMRASTKTARWIRRWFPRACARRCSSRGSSAICGRRSNGSPSTAIRRPLTRGASER